ncbi:hypothetical protein IAU60_000523 [Kwoniella sp. DSM 27419]
MPGRPSKRPRPASYSPEVPTHHRDGLDLREDDDEPSASHLVSFLTGYADHHSSGSSSGDDRDGFELPSDDDEEDEEEERDPDEEDEPTTPGRRAKTGLVGTSTSRKTTPRKRKGSKTPGGGVTPRKTPSKKRLDPLELEAADQQGIIRLSKADRYFVHAGRPQRSSGNSYSLLEQPLSQAQYDRYTSESSEARARLRPPEAYEERYDQWLAELDAGYGLMFYGFGSKRLAVNRFAKSRLASRGHLVVINGHFPQLSIRDMLSSVEDTLSAPQDIPIPASSNSNPIERSAHRIYSYFLPLEAIHPSKRKQHAISDKDLYLVMHNIDSPSLRTPRSVSTLSLLASSPRIKIISTFDHLHTPLLFSPSLNNTPPHTYPPGGWTGTPHTDRGFNWIYHNMTTYAPYDLELSYLRLSAASSHLSLSSSTSGISEEGALQILRSVPPMAARLLKLLLTKQLSNLPPDAKHHTAYAATQIAPVFAIDNDIMQAAAKEKFIAREEERYDALIGEFRDHGLVVEAQVDPEGRTGRWIWVPLGKAAVERVLETMQEVEV